MVRRLIAIIATMASVMVMIGSSPVRADDPAIRIVVIGDSISAPCAQSPIAGWCAEFDRLLTVANVPHVIIGRAIPGVDCKYWSDRIGNVLATDRPDLVLINCGTNNWVAPGDPGDVFGQQWRTIVEASHQFGAKVGIQFIGYSIEEMQNEQGRSWLVPSEGAVNDTIYRNMQYYWAAGWFAGLADMQQIPGTLDHIDTTTGIHVNERGQIEYARLWYRALRTGSVAGSGYAWPDVAPQPCGMWGHRTVYDPPAGWVPCGGLT